MKLTDGDLRELEAEIRRSPDGAPIMRGTGGLRKIRFAPLSHTGGKSGGSRACYAYFPRFGLVYLCAVFPKNAKANLTKAEAAEFKQVIEAVERHLRKHWILGWTP